MGTNSVVAGAWCSQYARISTMEKQDETPQPSTEPIYLEGHRMPVSLTFLFSLVVVVVGVLTAAPMLIVVAVGVAVFNWFTSPRQHAIYQNALVVAYGRPRTKIIYFEEIAEVELMSLALGSRVRLKLVNGRREIMQPKEGQTFFDQLQGALVEFRRGQSGEDAPEEATQDSPPAS